MPVMQMFLHSNILALTASASPSSVGGFRSGTGTATSDPTICTASGGIGTISYLWEKVSGTTLTVTSSTSASTTFSSVMSIPGETKTGVYRCKCTSGAEVVYSNNVTASLERGA